MCFAGPKLVSDGMCTAGYGPEDETCVYELTYNYGQDKYDNFKGEGYAQVAMSTEVMLLHAYTSVIVLLGWVGTGVLVGCYAGGCQCFWRQ